MTAATPQAAGRRLSFSDGAIIQYDRPALETISQLNADAVRLMDIANRE